MGWNSRNIELHTTLLLNLLGAGRSGDLELKKKGVLVKPPWFSDKVDWRKFIAPSKKDGEAGRDGEEEEQPELPDPEAPLTDQQINVPRNRKRVVNTLEPARKSKRTRRIPNKFLHFISFDL